MKRSIFAVIAAVATLTVSAATVASAATVTGARNITSSGQTLGFVAAAPEDNAAGGFLNIVLNGDFSPNYTSGEYADVSIDTLGGSMRLAFTGGTNVVFNTIAGLNYVSSSAFETSNSLDAVLRYTFSVSSAALSTILSDNLFFGQFRLGSAVNPYNRFDRDFVSATLSYDTAAPVPLPAGLPLLAGALGGLGYLRSRKTAAPV